MGGRGPAGRRHTEPKATRRARDAILEAAEAIFGERGFRKTTLEDVATAGVSRPLVYRYFGDKRGLFALVVDRVLREWYDVLIAEGGA